MAFALATVDEAVPLCRAGGHTCVACCHGADVGREELHRQVARQTRLFVWLFGRGPSTQPRAVLFELLARGPEGLLLGLLLLLPLVGDLLRRWLERRVVCSFLGFEDAEHTRVGCMLHPSRWGRDMRQRAAFAFWLGFACGAGDWYCAGARRYARAPQAEREAFLRRAAGLGWYEFGQEVTRYGGPISPPRPSRPGASPTDAAGP
jgi:hypothetical protein